MYARCHHISEKPDMNGTGMVLPKSREKQCGLKINDFNIKTTQHFSSSDDLGLSSPRQIGITTLSTKPPLNETLLYIRTALH
jgi:hypothetical protein